jgi:hypothetical protein
MTVTEDDDLTGNPAASGPEPASNAPSPDEAAS